MTKWTRAFALASSLVGAAATVTSAQARDLSTFGDGVPGSYQVDPDAPVTGEACPNVVVLNVPFCTDETGQAACINGDRGSIAAAALEMGDYNGDNLTYAFIQAGASHLASMDHNINLTKDRAAFTLHLLQSYPDVGIRVAGYQALFGESFASGGANADFNFDRFGQAFITDFPELIVQMPDGRYVPRADAVVASYDTPPCNRHLRELNR